MYYSGAIKRHELNYLNARLQSIGSHDYFTYIYESECVLINNIRYV